jgi:hypothetical protein
LEKNNEIDNSVYPHDHHIAYPHYLDIIPVFHRQRIHQSATVSAIRAICKRENQNHVLGIH